jgi:class 3 adenylate cyclase
MSVTKTDPESFRSKRERQMTETHSFGYWLRRRRKALDLTQAELAVRVGCAEVTIRRIEADERRPSRQIAQLLADQLGVPPEEQAAFIQAARAELGVDRLAPASPAVVPEAVGSTTAPTAAAASASSNRLPSGTVTFLFTDIEGSAALAQHYPAALPLLLTRHHAILRDSIEAHHGHVFKITGDAFCAAFDTATNTLQAALQAQRQLQNEPWQPAAINVRMGIHTGAAQAGASEEVGGGYDGYLTLTRAQRVMSAAHGGQVLLSNTSAELVHGQLPEGITLRDMGEHHLKGLLTPERVWQVAAVELRSDFPPLMARSASRNNLPAQPTPLIGRAAEVRELGDLLRRVDVRLVTLTGPGGIGKTSLARQVAIDLLDDFGDGVWFVNLAPITDLALVVSAIAQTLGIKESGS